MKEIMRTRAAFILCDTKDTFYKGNVHHTSSFIIVAEVKGDHLTSHGNEEIRLLSPMK